MATREPTISEVSPAASKRVATAAVGDASTTRPNLNAELLFYEGNQLAMADSLDLSSFTFFGNTRTMQERINNLNSHSEFQRKVELRHLLEIAEEVSFYFQRGVCTTANHASIEFEVLQPKLNAAINFTGQIKLTADARTGWINKIHILFLTDSLDRFLRANAKPNSDSEKKRVVEEVFTHLILPELNQLIANPTSQEY